MKKLSISLVILFVFSSFVLSDTTEDIQSYVISDDYNFSNVININVKPFYTTTITFNGFDAETIKIAPISSVILKGKEIKYYSVQKNKMSENSIVYYLQVTNIPDLPSSNLTFSYIEDKITRSIVFEIQPYKATDPLTLTPTQAVIIERKHILTNIPKPTPPADTTTSTTTKLEPNTEFNNPIYEYSYSQSKIDYFLKAKFSVINKTIEENDTKVIFSVAIINSDSVKFYFSFTYPEINLPVNDIIEKVTIANKTYTIKYNDNLKCLGETTSNYMNDCLFMFDSKLYEYDNIKLKPIFISFKNGTTIKHE